MSPGLKRSLAALLLALLPANVWAQPVPSREPSSTHIFPAGGQRGTAVDVRVGAECLPPKARLHLRGEGVQAPAVLGDKVQGAFEASPRRLPTEIPISYPKEWQSRIEIAPDTPLGMRHWWLSCAQGGSGIRTFVVGELPEYIERESNSLPERAETVNLPVTINGQIAGERDIDYYRFTASEGQVISCDLASSRLGSPLEAVIDVRSLDGRRIGVDELRVGSDPVAVFRAVSAGEYLVSVSNLQVHGGPAHVYRLTIDTRGYRAFAFPTGGRSGESRSIDLFTLTGDGAYTAAAQLVDFDWTPGTRWWHGGSPAGNPVLLASGEVEAVEAEDNDSPGAANRLDLGVHVSGRLERVSDEDWFAFEAAAGRAVSMTCRAFPKWLGALPTIELHGSTGGVLAASRCVDDPDGICRIEWSPPNDGLYHLRVRDIGQHARGGPHFVYRLSLSADRPDFSLLAAGDAVNVQPGQRAELELRLTRTGGFAGAVDCVVEGLCDGVRAEPLRIAGDQNSARLVFTADPAARPANMVIAIAAQAVDRPELKRLATARHHGCDAEALSVGSPAIDWLHLTVQHEPVFRLFCNEAYQYAHRGTVYPYSVEVERLAGFEGPITLQLGDRQNRDLDGIEFWEIVVPPGVRHVDLPVYLPETMHINVQSQSQVYSQGYALFTDRWGTEQSQLIVSEKRCMLRTLPTVARLTPVAGELTGAAGGTVACPLELTRTPNFPGAMRIELIEPAAGQGFSADTILLKPGETTAAISVQVAGDAPREAMLRFRGTGDMAGGAMVVSEAVVPFRLAP